MNLQEINRDCFSIIFSNIFITDLYKYKRVSKYFGQLVNEYIKNNSKICDIQAYDCAYLVVPEYLVIDENKCKKTGYLVNFILSIHKFSTTLRLVMFKEKKCKFTLNKNNAFAKRVDNKNPIIIDLYMPELKYTFCKNIKLNINNTPKIKYTTNFSTINSYKILSGKNMDIINRDNTINTYEKLYVKSKNVDFRLIMPNNNIKEIYVNARKNIFDNISEVFPNLRKIYLELHHLKTSVDICINNVYIRKIDMSFDYGGRKIYDGKVAIYTNKKTIIILKDIILSDLLEIAPVLTQIYIYADKFNFKLGNLQIVNANLNDEIKKAIFS